MALQTLIDEVGAFKLTRGPRPASYAEFLSLNAPLVINLEVGFFEFFHDLRGEEDGWAASAKVRLIHRPMSDWFPPDYDQVMGTLFKIFDGLKTGNVHVHCRYGDDRTGIVSAAWRICKDNWSVQAATNEMYAMGFHKWPYLYWVPTLQLFTQKFN